MSKVRSTTVVAEGYIKDTDHYPATESGKQKQTKDGSMFVQESKDKPWRGVKVKNPQKMSIVKGFLVEQKTHPNGYVYDAPVVYKTGEVRTGKYATDAPKFSLKDRFAALIRRKTCTSHSKKK